jgi:hypothetical protein
MTEAISELHLLSARGSNDFLNDAIARHPPPVVPRSKTAIRISGGLNCIVWKGSCESAFESSRATKEISIVVSQS